MAEALGHKWGQLVGELLETANVQLLGTVATKYNLYLDSKGARPARAGRKVTWNDKFGNAHDLDYVLERGGSETTVGQPAAFIESAWRRYTKHSRNKAQEIEGAVGPLAATYSQCKPFLGVILAGEFTRGSLAQLKSKGFSVLYFPYATVIRAFAAVRVDASFEEATTEDEFREKLTAWGELDNSRHQTVIDTLFGLSNSDIEAFKREMGACFSRTIERIIFLPLHGSAVESLSVREAILALQNYNEAAAAVPQFARYEIEVRYSNGDNIRAAFRDKAEAVKFLGSFL
jgi:hypothetical protein